ncbi:D-alanyl-D-alanine carboxypeptidase [Streptomyces sp. NPDC087300]|uniref:D-alanyl-D-alanine carboxypeptidase n=1 Tax=Streptomyces sp. NPDC087300 TaxID=3365780 RepID=UPI00380CA7A7
MAYEEASVAGETPDRSEQRKSSGNPTAADPSAPEERDPRLAVAREVPAAREDRATAVFSTKAVVSASDEAASDEVASDEAGSDGESPSGDSPTDEKTSEASSSDKNASDASPSDGKTSDESSSDEKAPGESTADETSSEDAPSGDARLRDAVAAWVASDEPEADADADSARGNDSAGADEGPGAGAADDDADAPDAEADADAPAAGEAESEESGSGRADGESSDDDAPAEAEPKSDADADADVDDAKDGEGKDAPAGGVDQATAVFKALSPKAGAKAGDKPAGQGVDQATTMLKLSDLQGLEKSPAKSPEKDSAKSPEKDSAKSADAAESGEAKAPAKGSANGEREAERTSKFVALKPLDEPAAKPVPKPAPKPDEAAAPKGGAKAAAAGAAATAAPTSPTGPTGPAVPPPVERTTQQPLPPKPPIDLLAELTNTPPPPETPVRTAVRRVKIWTPLVLLMVVVFAVVQAVRPLPTPSLQLTAEESVSFEGGKPSVPWPGEGQAAMDVNGIGTFGTSGKQKPVPIASIAKVMTVYLILRDHPLKKGEDGPKIPVDAAAQKHYETGKPANESVVKVTEGQKISQYEALQAVMLPSANNVAKLLARWDTKSSSEDEFVAKMNKTAKELGMKNTHYTDPSGLDKTTVSTAEDLVKLGRAAMENPVFNEISRQPSYKDLNGDKQKNFFGLIPTVAIGIKTGTTTAAGGNILFAAEKVIDGKRQTIIGATLGQYGDNGVANIDEVTRVTKELIEAGQGALKSKTIVKKGDVVGRVDDGLGGTTPVVATKDVAAVGWSGLTVKLELKAEKGKTLPNSAKAGTKVGVLSVGDGKGGAVEVPVALQKDLSEPSFGSKLTRVG